MKNIQYWAVTLVAFKASVPFAVSKSNRVENIFAESCNIILPGVLSEIVVQQPNQSSRGVTVLGKSFSDNIQ